MSGIASPARAERRASTRRAISLWVEGVDVVGVGCGDDVGDAVLGGHAGHCDGCLEVGRAVVKAGKQMMVNIDHDELSPEYHRADGLNRIDWDLAGSAEGVSCIEVAGLADQRLHRRAVPHRTYDGTGWNVSNSSGAVLYARQEMKLRKAV